MSPTENGDAVTSMEARYKQELSGRDPTTLIDLILDNCTASKITGLPDNLTNLQSLSIINAGLDTLKGLPHLPALLKLDLSNNLLTGDLEIIAANCPQLLHLNLSGNSIESANALEPLAKTIIAEIDIFSNPVSADDEHRQKIFQVIPGLQILDGCDASGEEVDEDDSLAGEDSEGDDLSDDTDDGPGLSYLDRTESDGDSGEDEDYDPERRTKRKRSASEGGADEEGDEQENGEPAAKRA